jgi:hypothetical protein
MGEFCRWQDLCRLPDDIKRIYINFVEIVEHCSHTRMFTKKMSKRNPILKVKLRAECKHLTNCNQRQIIVLSCPGLSKYRKQQGIFQR